MSELRPAERRQQGRSVGPRLAALSLLLLLFALLTMGARHNALTADEPAYIAGGYAWWARGLEAATQLLPQRGYPPLLAALEALPVYLAQPDIPLEQLAGWPDDFDAFSLAFKPYLGQSSELAARMATIWLTVLLGAVVFRWASDLPGPTDGRARWTAGLLALSAMTLDPTLLAHGRLAHSDAGAVALGATALFLAWRWSQRPTWPRAVALGVLLAMTLLAKVSGPLWLAAAALLLATTLVERRREGRTGRLLGQAAAALGLAGLLWWAAYGFTWGRVAGGALVLPAPAYWQSIAYLRSYTTDIYALGLRQAGEGWWWYFPLAFLLKNPLPLLLALAIALAALLRRPGPRQPSRVVALAAFPLLYSAVAIVNGMNIGYRHMLPLHPFLYLAIGSGLAGWAWPEQGQARRWRPWAVAGLGLWLAVSLARVYPWEISYFNALAGGPGRGHRYLADSNADWGQADRVRDRYLAAHPDTLILPPAARLNPAPGTYLVSAAKLQGSGISPVDVYEWFRHRQPDEVLAHSQLIYRVDDVPGASESARHVKPAWLVQCNQPVTPLPAEAVRAQVGPPEQVRSLEVDCTQSWLYPGGGAAEGLVALHDDLLAPRRLCLPALLPCPPKPLDPFIARHLAGATLSFEQPEDGQLPAFALFQRAAGVSAAISPIELDGPLAFLGAAAYGEGQEIEVETRWQVVASPGGHAFSIMGHGLDAAGAVVAVSDGLGVSPLALQPGDVLVQRHRFPAGSGIVQLRTGAYWLDSLERWPRLDDRSQDTITLSLDQLVQPDADDR